MRISDWSSDVCSSDLHAGHHRGDGHVRGGDARTAEAVEGDAAGGDVVAGVEGGHAPEVAALGADLHARAPHHVVEDRKSTRLNSSHYCATRMTSSACKT